MPKITDILLWPLDRLFDVLTERRDQRRADAEKRRVLSPKARRLRMWEEGRYDEIMAEKAAAAAAIPVDTLRADVVAFTRPES